MYWYRFADARQALRQFLLPLFAWRKPSTQASKRQGTAPPPRSITRPYAHLLFIILIAFYETANSPPCHTKTQIATYTTETPTGDPATDRGSCCTAKAAPKGENHRKTIARDSNNLLWNIVELSTTLAYK